MSAVSAGIHNVYNGIEDLLLSLARDIDDAMPTGPSAHQDVLDQMAAEIAGTRPALLDLALLRKTFPAFLAAVTALERTMKGEPSG